MLTRESNHFSRDRKEELDTGLSYLREVVEGPQSKQKDNTKHIPHIQIKS